MNEYTHTHTHKRDKQRLRERERERKTKVTESIYICLDKGQAEGNGYIQAQARAQCPALPSPLQSSTLAPRKSTCQAIKPAPSLSRTTRKGQQLKQARDIYVCINNSQRPSRVRLDLIFTAPPPPPYDRLLPRNARCPDLANILWQTLRR